MPCAFSRHSEGLQELSCGTCSPEQQLGAEGPRARARHCPLSQGCVGGRDPDGLERGPPCV